MRKGRFIHWGTMRRILVDTQFAIANDKNYMHMDRQWKLGYLKAIEDIVFAVERKNGAPSIKDFSITGYEALIMDIKEDIGGSDNDYEGASEHETPEG